MEKNLKDTYAMCRHCLDHELKISTRKMHSCRQSGIQLETRY